jgi:GTP1/Obg family GTP-binding protein
MMEFDIDQKKYPKREENRIENHKINGMRNLEKIVLGTFDEGGGRPRP